MDNSEKLATHGTQDEEKQNKNTTQLKFVFARKNVCFMD
jgi:hypothetical protein